MKFKETNLLQIQQIQLGIALEVKRLCEKYNLRYFIIAGTLLGAVRHKGFIPWDDDLDIGMLREDYDRFIKVAAKELSQEYFLQTWDTDEGFGLPFTKIRKNGTRFVEKNSAKTKGHKGIYVDIFPFDYAPVKKVKRITHNVFTYVLKRIMLCKTGYEVWHDGNRMKRFSYKVLNFTAKFIPRSFCKHMLNKQMINYTGVQCTHVVNIGGAYGYAKETLKREWVEELIAIKFEGVEFMCPKDYDGYLTYFYGNYMIPPPIKERYNRHGIIEIVLGDENE